MNKGERNRITNKKWLKRLKIVDRKPEEGYLWKHNTKPCSCIFCSPNKYSRKTKHK